MTQPDWQELTTLLAISFEDTQSIAELQCAVMARGDVTPPKKCQERLAAALSGQLTPIIRALEKAARTADPPLPGAQPDSAAPSTWESVFPCEWHVKEEVVGGVVGGVLGGVLGGQVGSTGSGPDVLPFGAGMTRPEKISGPVPQYTPEAIAAGVQGLVIAKCVITAEGKVERCRMIKPLPHMEQAVLDALYASRYKPVTLHGEPVVVDYTFNIKLSLPTRGGER
jgi:TonB family protein